MIVFLALLLTLLTTCWYVVGCVLAPIVPGGGWTVLAAALLSTALPLATLVGTRALGHYPGSVIRLLVFRPFWYAMFAVLLLTLASAAGALVGAPFGRAAEAARVALFAVATIGVVGAVAGYIGHRRLEIRHLVATLPGLPAELDGLVIAQFSDLHVGPQTSRALMAKAERAVREASPDLIAVTGDLIDDFPADVDHYAEVFGAISAPLGVYVIPGNHEVYAGWEEVRARLERLPVRVLVNESVVVEVKGRHGTAERSAAAAVRLVVAGTGDPAFGPGTGGDAGPDIERTLADVPPDTFVLALAHNPALWPALAARGVDFTLSGHTHWGQLAFPRLGWSLANPFLTLAMGAHTSGRSLLYIHPGTGYWGLPFRLGHSAEVAIIRLERGEETGFRVQGSGG
jgi:predicted MPP superfamily phosphohydrolase